MKRKLRDTITIFKGTIVPFLFIERSDYADTQI